MSTRTSGLIRTVAVAGIASAILGAGVFLGVRLALALPGVAGGPTTNSLTFSGVLRGPDGGTFSGTTATLTFVFRKPGAGGVLSDVCRSPASTVAVSGTGVFTTSVSLENCPSTMFDGNDVAYSILQTASDGGVETIASDVAITPVPYARFADQAGVNNDCPSGYLRSVATGDGGYIVCTRQIAVSTGPSLQDEVVRVGRGASAFWVDRYEATVYDATGRRFGEGGADYASVGGLAPTGRWVSSTVTAPPLQAVSRSGVIPSRNITWFQASEVCRAAGKRLLTREEWFAAIQGTDDPTVSNDGIANARCNTGGASARETGRGTTGCTSAWGVQDMIGNLWEWTSEWYASVGALNSPSSVVSSSTVLSPPARLAHVTGVRVNDALERWGSDYGGDATWNVTSTVYNTADGQEGIPSAAIRGGAFGDGPPAGEFALNLNNGPSNSDAKVGFRCVVSR